METHDNYEIVADAVGLTVDALAQSTPDFLLNVLLQTQEHAIRKIVDTPPFLPGIRAAYRTEHYTLLNAVHAVMYNSGFEAHIVYPDGYTPAGIEPVEEKEPTVLNWDELFINEDAPIPVKYFEPGATVMREVHLPDTNASALVFSPNTDGISMGLHRMDADFSDAEFALLFANPDTIQSMIDMLMICRINMLKQASHG